MSTLLQLHSMLDGAAASGGGGQRQQQQQQRPLNLVACVNDGRTHELMQSLTDLCNHSSGNSGSSSSSLAGSDGTAVAAVVPAPRRPITLDLINPDELLSGVLTQVRSFATT